MLVPCFFHRSLRDTNSFDRPPFEDPVSIVSRERVSIFHVSISEFTSSNRSCPWRYTVSFDPSSERIFPRNVYTVVLRVVAAKNTARRPLRSYRVILQLGRTNFEVKVVREKHTRGIGFRVVEDALDFALVSRRVRPEYETERSRGGPRQNFYSIARASTVAKRLRILHV